jgi:hypothetical protein
VLDVGTDLVAGALDGFHSARQAQRLLNCPNQDSMNAWDCGSR